MTTAMLDSINWRNAAACADTDPELFFPNKSNAAAQADQAIRVCYRCPVRQQCLTEALALPPHRLHVGMVAGGRYFQTRSNT